MVRRLCIGAVALALIVVSNGVQALDTPFFERSNGTYGYVVQENDDLGQWQIALEDGKVWLELVKSNPQLADPDKVWPGDTLNVPPSLIRTFELLTAAKTASETRVPVLSKLDTTATSAAVERNSFPWGTALLLLVIAGLAAFALYCLWRRERDRFIRMANQAIMDNENQRRLSDPYSGPPVRESGIPTSEAAEAFFAETYRSDRERLTVAQSNALPPTVAIERIEAVDVRGPMLVHYASGGPQERNLDRWTPAWLCRLSDGSVRIALMACANDVRAGHGGEPLPSTQIRPRQDIPSREVQRQVWPVATEQTAPVETPTEVSATIVDYTSARVTSPSRYVLHRTNGRETVIDLGVLANAITLGIEGGTIYAIVGDQRRTFGRIVEPVEETTVPSPAVPAGDGAVAPSKQ